VIESIRTGGSRGDKGGEKSLLPSLRNNWFFEKTEVVLLPNDKMLEEGQEEETQKRGGGKKTG